MKTDEAMFDALDKAYAVVSAKRFQFASYAGQGPKPQVASSASLCKKYAEIRRWLLIAIPFIEKIPLYGKKISGILVFLMGIADSVCPTVE